ncbi:class I SAM-dependent methyltransferase [Candidatus Woesearchaeota archaeon]|nr:class I SAM-dependent methyltransferase [Candidatus Woesearchaeota archaeon]
MEHYFSPKPASPLREMTIAASLLGHQLAFKIPSGTFSAHGVDKGTKLLIESALIQGSWSILDFGCGWGVVGIALGKAFPSAKVTFVDVNKRALAYTSRNCMENRIANAEFIGGKIPEGMKFDTILLNPPQHAGKDACYAMFKEAKEHLKPDGIFQIVARHNKGGRSYSNKLIEIFGNVNESAKKGGYRVYVGRLSGQK